MSIINPTQWLIQYRTHNISEKLYNKLIDIFIFIYIEILSTNRNNFFDIDINNKLSYLDMSRFFRKKIMFYMQNYIVKQHMTKFTIKTSDFRKTIEGKNISYFNHSTNHALLREKMKRGFSRIEMEKKNARGLA